MRILSAAAVIALAAAAAASVPEKVPLPGGQPGGIGFDDLELAPSLGKLLIPAGRTGNLDLVDPATGEITTIGGFTASGGTASGHGEGTTSAVEGPAGVLFASDRDAKKLVVVDAGAKKIVASAALAGGPDYVRWVEATREVWVTEPSKQQIEVFSVGKDPLAAPVHTAVIAVAGGPESLVIDAKRGKAYTHLWKGTTLAIDLKSRAIGSRWKNGCKTSLGIALDAERGWVFVGCDEGTAVALDVEHGGKVLSSASSGGEGVDIIAWDPSRRHLYVPGGDSATMGVMAVSTAGTISLLQKVSVASDSHCVVADGHGGVWICDPSRGGLLHWTDGS